MKNLFYIETRQKLSFNLGVLAYVLCVFVDCVVDSNADNLSPKAVDESSGEFSVSASLTTDDQLKAKLEEYERVICQQQELMLQVVILETFPCLIHSKINKITRPNKVPVTCTVFKY